MRRCRTTRRLSARPHPVWFSRVPPDKFGSLLPDGVERPRLAFKLEMLRWPVRSRDNVCRHFVFPLSLKIQRAIIRTKAFSWPRIADLAWLSPSYTVSPMFPHSVFSEAAAASGVARCR